MATFKKCDRCGTEEMVRCSIKITEPAPYCSSSIREYDLCQPCHDAIIKGIHGNEVPALTHLNGQQDNSKRDGSGE